MSIYKACDIRGRFGTELKVYHAYRLGTAIAALKGPIPVLVGGDGRVSTPALKEALVSSLVSSGCQVNDLGQISTPMLYFARQRLGIETGVMVTASHNPAGDNGFKIVLGPLPITEEELGQLASLMERSGGTTAGKPGRYSTQDLTGAYLDFAEQFIPDLTGMNVMVDCANGMTGPYARAIWEKTGARVRLLLEDVRGDFPVHSPNPSEAKSMVLLQEAVVAGAVDVGIAYDGDGDRAAFVDETGQILIQDKAIVLLARDALRDGPETIIYDQKCSRIVPDAVQALGGQPRMEPSGHTYIKRAFIEENAAYGGELSGHHFLRDVGGDDGLLASMYMARILRESGETLSRLSAAIPSYPITPDIRIPMTAHEIEMTLNQIQEALQGKAAVSVTDGLRIEFADGWGLVRASVTEPVLTMRFEGQDEAALRRVIQRIISCSDLLYERAASKLLNL